MNRSEARQLLAESAAARDAWLRRITKEISATALWLVGSLARGEGDEWSDIDLVVVGAEPALDEALLTTEVPHNGPIGGRYIGAMYGTGPLPVRVDWYLWPASLPAPREARLLSGYGRPGDLSLAESLDRHGRNCSVPSTDASTRVMAMLPLVAKSLARGRIEAANRLATMIGVDGDRPLLEGLRDLLAATPAGSPIHDRVSRAIEVAAALTDDQANS